MRFQESPGVRSFAFHNCFRCSGHDDLVATTSSIRSKVNHVVSRFDDIAVMFYYDHNVSCVGQLMETIQKSLYVCQVKAGCWFIQDV
jgi:hypothetical protein